MQIYRAQLVRQKTISEALEEIEWLLPDLDDFPEILKQARELTQETVEAS